MATQTKDSGKTFNFYLKAFKYYETTSDDDGYSHVSMDCKSICLDIKSNGRLMRDLTETLASKGHDSRGYWGDNEYAKYFEEESNNLEFHRVKVRKLIDQVTELRLKYNPEEDKLSFEYEPGKKIHNSMNWKEQYSAKHLTSIIEEEMKRLIPKNKPVYLDFQI